MQKVLNSGGVYDNLYPKSKAGLVEIIDTAGNFVSTDVEGALAETAEQIRDISVEADTIPLSPATANLYGLTGADANVDKALTYTANRIAGMTGNATYTDLISAQGRLTKSIAVGSNRKHGQATIYHANILYGTKGGVFVRFNTQPLRALVSGGWMGYNSDYSAGAWSVRKTGWVTQPEIGQFGAYASGNSYISIEDLYINGTNINIVFYNPGSTAQSLNCEVDWEVW